MTAAYLLFLLPATFSGYEALPAAEGIHAPVYYGRVDRSEHPGVSGPGPRTRLAVHLMGSHTVRLVNRPVSSAGRLAFFLLDTSGGWVRRADVRFRRFPNLGRTAAHPVTQRPGMDLAAWEEELNDITTSESLEGRVDYLIGGDAYFVRLETVVREATSCVDLQTYIFDNDDVARDIADLLRERSEQIGVRVLFDGLGTLLAQGATAPTLPDTHRPPACMKRYLQTDTRVEVRSIENPWFTGDHCKNIIVDRRIAFLGGMNIGREYRHEWHDMMVEVQGPVVTALQREFEVTWARSGPRGDLGLLWNGTRRTPTSPPGTGHPVRVIRSGPGRSDIHRAQLAAARRAQQRIYLENAYFADDALLYELCRARRRGVDVRVIMPAEPNHDVMRHSNKVAARTLLRHGVRVYVYPGMSHIKAAVFDGWACVGTANYDKLSLQVNREICLAFSETEAVERLERELFKQDLEASQEMNVPEPLNLADHLWELVADEV